MITEAGGIHGKLEQDFTGYAFPAVVDGARAVRCIETVIESGRSFLPG